MTVTKSLFWLLLVAVAAASCVCVTAAPVEADDVAAEAAQADEPTYPDDGFTRDSGVIELSNDNFDQVLSTYEFVLVEFVAPWCGHCKRLAPEFQKAAQILASEGENAQLGRVDCTVEKDLAQRFGIRSYPTIHFFKSGKQTPYTGGRTQGAIAAWVKRNNKPPTQFFYSHDEFALFMKSNVRLTVALTLLPGSGTSAETLDATQEQHLKTLNQAAVIFEDVKFAVVLDPSVAGHYLQQAVASPSTSAPTLLLFRPTDSDDSRSPVVFERDFSANQVITFVDTSRFDLVQTLSFSTSAPFLGSRVPDKLVVVVEEHDDIAAVSESLSELARSLRAQILFGAAYRNDASLARFFQNVGIDKDNDVFPQVRIFQNQKANFIKYAPQDYNEQVAAAIDVDSIRQFVKDYQERRLSPMIKTAKPPAGWDQGSVYVLVGANHDQVVNDPTKNVFVEYYAPWCGHCKRLEPVWNQLGDAFANRDDVIIAKTDATANEYGNLSIRGYPTLKFWPAGSTPKTPVDYRRNRSLEALQDFVEQTAVPIAKFEEPNMEADAEIKDEL